MLDQDITRPESEWQADCKTHSTTGCRFVKIQAIYKNQKDLDDIIMPKVNRYYKRNLSTEEAGIINQKESERRTKEANEQISHPTQETMGKITNLNQLKPQDVQEFMDYSKSTAALHDFFAGQTGLQIENFIPQAEFVKTLKQIELVDFKGDQEVMIRHWITHPAIRKNFNILFRLFQGFSRGYQSATQYQTTLQGIFLRIRKIAQHRYIIWRQN